MKTQHLDNIKPSMIRQVALLSNGISFPSNVRIRFFGGYIPFFGKEIPCIAFASIFGIILNLILMKKGNYGSVSYSDLIFIKSVLWLLMSLQKKV